MRAILISALKISSYVVVTIIAMVTIAMSASHFLAPIVAGHRIDIEKWATQLLKTPVTINQVELSWYQYQPVINLNAVTVLNKDTHEPALQIQKIRLFFSIPKSVWYLKPVTSGILISGTEISAHSSNTGEMTVQGFPAFGGKEEPYKSETRMKDILGWLTEQPRLILQNIDVHYSTHTGKQWFVTLQKLSILNSTSKHIILGKGILHQDLPTSLNLAIDWQGNPIDPSSIKANAYAYVSGLSLDQWLKDSEWQGWQVKNGVSTAKIWVDWEHNAVQKIQSAFQIYDFALYSNNDHTTHEINRLSGNVGWQRDGHHQTIAGDEILIDFAHHLWPMTSFRADLIEDEANNNQLQPQHMSIGYVDLDDVQSFLFASPHGLPDTVYTALNALKPSGSIQNITIDFPKQNWLDWHHTAIDADITQLTTNAWQHLPSIANLSARIKWQDDQGELEFKNILPVTIGYDEIFTKPLTFNQFTGKITAKLNQQIWQLQTDDIQILNHDLAANVKGQLTFGVDKDSAAVAPQIDLSSHFTLEHAQHISHYLPLRIFDAKLVTWLQQAFKSGEVTSGDAILKGKLADFPFDQGNGLFKIDASVANLDLKYAPDWPMIKNMDGKVSFVGRQIVVDADNASLLNIPLHHIHAIIPEISDRQPAILTVTSNDAIQADFAEGIRFLKECPLKATIGKMFNGIDMSGPIRLQLGLTVPLEDADKTKVEGDLQFQNADMNMKLWELQITNLNGQLHFTENDTNADGIRATLFNKPMTIGINTRDKTVEAHFKTNLAVDDLQQWLHVPFSHVAQGASDVNGRIDISQTEPLNIHLQSNLQGMALTLPYQFGKDAPSSKEFNADISIAEKQPVKILLNYDQALGAALTLNKTAQSLKLYSANLHLGGGTIAWPKGAGLYISGNFDRLDWDTIKKYSAVSNNQITHQHEKTNENANENANEHESDLTAQLPLRNINIHANTLQLGSQEFHEVELQLAKNANLWNIDIDSPDVVGHIELPVPINPSAKVRAQFKKINLSSSSTMNTNDFKFDIKSLPAIMIDANELAYTGINVGRVHIDAAPSESGLEIKDLKISSSRSRLQATGVWLNSNETHMHGSLMTANVSRLLSHFGMDSTNYIISNGRINFDLNWPHAPFAFKMSELEGTARIDINHGRIVDVGESNNTKMDIARVLNLFSLQNLPRRLSLDFSDLFQKGYSFDYIRGNFVFKDGNAFTQNLALDGPVLRVAIDGRINLAAKIYDLTLSITPHDMTSGIPVAAAAFFIPNPLIGLAALGVNTVLSQGLSQVATYYYNITGPWGSPTWHTVSR